MVLRPIISRLYGNPVSARSLNISASCIVKRLALANTQRPPGSYAERPLGQTAGVLRFRSLLEGLTDKGALCSGNCSEQFRVSGDCVPFTVAFAISYSGLTSVASPANRRRLVWVPVRSLWNSDGGESINGVATITALGRAYARSIPDVRRCRGYSASADLPNKDDVPTANPNSVFICCTA